MRIIHSLDTMTETARGWLVRGPVGFIPIMSTLHEGQKSLVRAAHAACEVTVVSIMANSLQTEAYKNTTSVQAARDITKDLQELSSLGVDVIFIPRIDALCPPQFSMYVTPTGEMAEKLTGIYHVPAIREFSTVMTKLLLLVRPDIVYLGRKKVHHVALIRQLVQDLSIDTALRVLPIVREQDGLVVSSHNLKLTQKERRAASLLYQALLQGKRLIEGGERQAPTIQKSMADLVGTEPLVTLIYAVICDAETFAPRQVVVPGTYLLLAARVGNIEIIDNFLWDEHAQWHS